MKKLVIMGIPHHGNLGDNAIAFAEEEILRKNFSNYEIFNMQEKYLDICANRVKKYIKPEDILLLHGGGNIGNTYQRPEKGRREVIQQYPNNKIIIFPQTVYFDNSEDGINELEKSKKIYNNHKNLIIMAREEKSYNFMKENFYNAKIYLTPDIVMTLNKAESKKRKGALLLFRNDQEKVVDNKDIEYIKNLINKYFENYKQSDTNLGSGIVNITGNLREKLLDEKFKEFQSSEIVITDRLHGMIFAAITETPCIVLKNFNYKISESYKWLNNLEYIKFCKNISEIEEIILKMKKVKNIKYNNNFAEKIIKDILIKEIFIV